MPKLADGNERLTIRRWSTTAACVMLAACGSGDPRVVSAGDMAGPEDVRRDVVDDSEASLGWRRIATSADRARVRGWRGAWINALAQVDARLLAEDSALFDPDRAVLDPLPPLGQYRCRTFKLGARNGTGPRFTRYGWFACRIEHDAEGNAIRLIKLDGSQRPVGTLFADSDARGIFLGTMELGDETRPMAYGRDVSRDMAGLIERIAPQRWRLVLPYPRFESIVDVIELVPAA